MMTCATCGVALDIRARFLSVRGGSVAAFCSADCRDGIAPPLAEPAEVAVATDARLTPAPPPAPVADASPRLRKTDRWPMSWKVAANLAGACFVGALGTLLVETAPSRPTPAVAAVVAAPIEEVAEPPLRDRALALLDAEFASDDPDRSFQAAEAFARLGREGGVTRLRTAMREPGNPRRLRAAAALLARADPDALEFLRARLDSRRREERAFAARTLALSGDDAGRAGLAALLSSTNTRLGAAEALAAVGDERGLAVLRRGLVSRDAETRARAATALGRVGDVAAADELRRVLAERRFEVGAAIALANLGDESARPALLAALTHSALRADAAEALLRLGGAAPEMLRDALQHDPATGQVQAALAILILSGEGR